VPDPEAVLALHQLPARPGACRTLRRRRADPQPADRLARRRPVLRPRDAPQRRAVPPDPGAPAVLPAGPVPRPGRAAALRHQADDLQLGPAVPREPLHRRRPPDRRQPAHPGRLYPPAAPVRRTRKALGQPRPDPLFRRVPGNRARRDPGGARQVGLGGGHQLRGQRPLEPGRLLPVGPQVPAQGPGQLPYPLPDRRHRGRQPVLPLPPRPAGAGGLQFPVPAVGVLERGGALLLLDRRPPAARGHRRPAVGKLLHGGAPGRPPLPAQPRGRAEQFDPDRGRTEGPGLGRTRHGEPFAPCYPRLLPRGPLPRTAFRRRGRRRRLPRPDAMNRLLASLLAVAIAGLAWALPAPTARAQSLQPLDRIVAVVDEDVILRSELDRALNNILSQYAGRENQLPPRDILERQVLDRLVLVQLQVARAAASGITVSDQELDTALSGIARQNNLTMTQLAMQLAQDGMTLADLRDSVRDEILVQRLRQSFAQSRISVSEGEVDAALAAQTNSTQYHLAHIAIAVPEGATPQQLADAQRRVEEVKARLDSGEIDFAAAAVRYSDSSNALEGGDLGWRNLDEIPPSFAQII